MSASVKGLDVVMRNLNREIGKLKTRSEAGLLKAAFVIKGDAVRLTPVVTGNLRASAFVVSVNSQNVSFNFSMQGSSPNKIQELARASDEAVLEAKRLVSDAKMPTVAVGFGAQYAWATHEYYLAGKTGKPGASTVGQWKFLETAVVANEKSILSMVAREARL